eukprot:4280078-Amphidinium_carterae.1
MLNKSNAGGTCGPTGLDTDLDPSDIPTISSRALDFVCYSVKQERAQQKNVPSLRRWLLMSCCWMKRAMLQLDVHLCPLIPRSLFAPPGERKKALGLDSRIRTSSRQFSKTGKDCSTHLKSGEQLPVENLLYAT